MLVEERVFVVLLVSVLTLYILNYFRRKPCLPPGPRPWPVIGNLNMMGALPHRSMATLSQSYGPIMTVYLGSVRCVVASTAHMARTFLTTHDAVFAGRPKLTAGKYTTYEHSIITWTQYEDQHWRMARRLCLSELFSVSRLNAFSYIRSEEIGRTLSSIFSYSLSRPVDVRKEASSLSNNIICRMVLGRRYLDENANRKIKPDEFREMLEELFHLNGVFNLGDCIPFLNFMDLQGYVKRMKAVAKKMDVFLEEIIQEHLENQLAVDGYVPKDLLDVLLQLSADPNVKLTNTRVKAYTMEMIASGTESSATLIEWGLSEMVRNPELLQKAAEEIDRVVGKERLVEENDLLSLPYLEAIAKETMRLYPVAPLLLPHESRGPSKVDGYDVPAKTRILVNAWAVMRDENKWKDANRFIPERFLEKSVDYKGNDFEFLPFGSGRRRCPGYSLGYKVVNLGLANMIHGFNWKLPGGQNPKDLDMSEIFGISCPRVHPLFALAEPRLASHLYKCPN